MKHVIDVGNCIPDHRAIRMMLEEHFDVTITQCQSLDEALSAVRSGNCHLMLVNRKLDRDYSDGLKVIQAVRADRELDHVPVMMITNFDDHQQLAVEAGAEYGFGKNAVGDSETLARLKKHLT